MQRKCRVLNWPLRSSKEHKRLTFRIPSSFLVEVCPRGFGPWFPKLGLEGHRVGCGRTSDFVSPTPPTASTFDTLQSCSQTCVNVVDLCSPLVIQRFTQLDSTLHKTNRFVDRLSGKRWAIFRSRNCFSQIFRRQFLRSPRVRLESKHSQKSVSIWSQVTCASFDVDI